MGLVVRRVDLGADGPDRAPGELLVVDAASRNGATVPPVVWPRRFSGTVDTWPNITERGQGVTVARQQVWST